MSKRCNQLWLVDATREGRVVGHQAATFERHRSACAECLGRERRLDALKSTLQSLPSGVPPALVVRRRRQDLLKVWDERLSSQRPVARRPLMQLLAGASLLVLTLAIWFLRTPHAVASWVEVVASDGAQWSDRRSGNEEQVELRDGHFQLTIRRPSPASRVAIQLPDGVIEDLGTVLKIWIAEGHTDYVSVQRGEVKLQLHGQSSLHLRAGQHWSRVPEVAESAPVERSLAPADSGSRSLAAGPATPPTPQHSPHTKVPHATQIPRARSEIGRNSASDVIRGSGGVIAEDAQYNQIVALLRQGAEHGALDSARDYLRRYPDGFRRAEVTQLVERLSPNPRAAAPADQ